MRNTTRSKRIEEHARNVIGVLIALTLAAFLGSLNGCTTTRQFGDRVGDAIDSAVNPECRRVVYERNRNVTDYYRIEGTGQYCKDFDEWGESL